MKVIAAKGLKVPREDNHRQHITDEVPVEVSASNYYRRLVRDGSLLIHTDEQPGQENQAPAQPAAEKAVKKTAPAPEQP